MENKNNDKILKLTVTCNKCGRKFTLRVKEVDYNNWKNGMLIQRAFPYLTSSQRELLLSNTCNECWNRLFPSL